VVVWKLLSLNARAAVLKGLRVEGSVVDYGWNGIGKTGQVRAPDIRQLHECVHLRSEAELLPIQNCGLLDDIVFIPQSLE
jgi:hypothetical protein